MIDTHCHLEKEFYDDIAGVIQDNIDNGITKMVVSGCNKKEIEEVLDYAARYDCIYLTLGFHPDTCCDITDNDIVWLEKIIKENPKVVGIGEIGLDYHYGKDNKMEQITLFEKQLMLAMKLAMPVVIHSRDATEDTISMLKKYKVKGVIHCFSGSVETAEIYIKLGFYLGIGGVVTFKNSKLDKVLDKLDLSNLVLETDSPYLTPAPHRGEVNSSKYIPLIVKKISEIYNVNIDDVVKMTTCNAEDVFDIW